MMCNETWMVSNLRINVQDTPPPQLSYILHSLNSRPIQIPGELRMFNERALVDERSEPIARRKVVLLPIRFPRSRRSSGV